LISFQLLSGADDPASATFSGKALYQAVHHCYVKFATITASAAVDLAVACKIPGGSGCWRLNLRLCADDTSVAAIAGHVCYFLIFNRDCEWATVITALTVNLSDFDHDQVSYHLKYNLL
jgi:hypothetical protein